MLISTLGIKAQSRDTLITKKLYFVEYGEGTSSYDSKWSNELKDYVEYSRINMGYRMNSSIKYNKIADNQFGAATFLSVMAATIFVSTAHSNPVIYVENHSRYTRKYYNDAKYTRNGMITMGSACAIGALYLFWRSKKNYNKSRWFISPDGIRYNF